MRSSIAFVSLFGALAMATPIAKPHHHHHTKRALTTDIVTETIWVTVYEDSTSSTSSDPVTITATNTVVVEWVDTSTTSSSTSTSTTPPPPPPTTTAAPETTPAPEPTTTEAPVQQAAQIQSTPAADPSPAPAPVAQTPPSSDYNTAALQHHNAHRANHSASALTWDDTLAGYALTTAQKCVFAHDMSEGNAGYGQNLAAYGTSEDLSSLSKASLVADAVTNQWYYGEYLDMIYDNNSPPTAGVPEYLHFTQVVWKGSNSVGCATVACPAGTIFGMGSMFTVCNYGPEGNVEGYFIANVGKPVGNPGIVATIS